MLGAACFRAYFLLPSPLWLAPDSSFDLFTGFRTGELEEVESAGVLFLCTSTFISGVPWNGDSCCPYWGLPPGLPLEPDPWGVLSSVPCQPQVSVFLGWHQPAAVQGENVELTLNVPIWDGQG